MTANYNFFEWNYSVLISSLKKIDLNIILIVILDIVFYFLSGYLIIFWLERLQPMIASINLPQDVVSLGYERGRQLLSQVRTFYYLVVLSFIFLLLAIIFLISILKGIIWAKITNTKVTFILISKFLGLNLIWMSFWFLLVFMIAKFIEPSLAPKFILAIIILGLYFTNTLYTIFMKEQKLKSIISGIVLNIKKIHLFLLPYTLIFLVFYIITKLRALLKFKYSILLISLIFVLYAAVLRYYVSTLILQTTKFK